MNELDTSRLLQQWNNGDSAALDALLRKHEGWIRQRVRKRLGTDLRTRLESTDILQEAFLRFLRDGPRLNVQHEKTFRSLMAIIVENAIRDTHDWFTRRRRDMASEQALPEEAIVHLDAHRPDPNEPSEALSQAEHQALVRMALELLRPEDQEILMLRTRDGMPFAAIGERLGIQATAADTRFRRAAVKLEKAIRRLRGREFSLLVSELEQDG